MPALQVTEATFEAEVINSDVPVLVDLYADWCGPCKQMAPTLDKLADEYDGSFKIVKVDIEANPGIAQAFRVQSIPMLVFIKDGRPIDAVNGALPESQLRQAIDQLAGPPKAKAGGIQPLEVKDAAKMLKEKALRPVDLREASNYGRARLPGAVNAPPDDRDTAFRLMAARSTTFLFYDRTDEGVADAAQAAAALGVQVATLTGGLLAWEADGHPVEKGAPTVELT